MIVEVSQHAKDEVVNHEDNHPEISNIFLKLGALGLQKLLVLLDLWVVFHNLKVHQCAYYVVNVVKEHQACAVDQNLNYAILTHQKYEGKENTPASDHGLNHDKDP